MAKGLAQGQFTLIDIRERDEYERAHIREALHFPLSALEKSDIEIEAGRQVVFHCRSGQRTEINCDRLEQHVEGDVLLMKGGLNAWAASGLPVVENRSAPMEINRQVQIAAGGLTLLGVLLGYFANPVFYVLAGFIGAGLMFSGLSGTCAMARILMAMPWNKTG